MTVDIVILAAGMGTRMKSALPKVLHPVAGRPMVLEVIATAQALAAQRIVTVVGHGAEEVKRRVGMDVSDFVLQAPQLGTGHAVMQARPLLGEAPAEIVLVLYGDGPLITAETLRHAMTTHRQRNAAVTLLSFLPDDPTGYGRIVRDGIDRVAAIVEHKDATESQRQIRESNSGIMLFDGAWLWPALDSLSLSPQGEYYLTDLIAHAVAERQQVEAVIVDEDEVMGINDRVQLAAASALLWQRRRTRLMRSGVTLIDPQTVWLDEQVTVAPETILHQNVILRGETAIGTGCEIGPNSTLQNVTVADHCRVIESRLFDCDLAEGTTIGPYEQLG
ncbi:MAG: bifunctional N-acetylglucosamine-1-phosphate uridyltransferase/glucosamine-1-phosphate acetyltransferase [Anaerolineales bacterium]|nr:bifunctional N-acetylglucosamine-1-phosphate uridyltransferase/glucosamine-1-phosphate acetyltransferase [Anaerolineales bacterium]MCB9127891.1 bifunctional N-acetylglucosamine-1-phosphate uridyltransferase/glucosamine-1-phosphate acetyltransferase [Ardenticatenales bacterium]MCB9171653.1 bifunctional N-acetylglucosamine-1-phosphate uridyltransferase/glucosamine-1-phosphate acetyltransferase [Ardenticatenales bacterium]